MSVDPHLTPMGVVARAVAPCILLLNTNPEHSTPVFRPLIISQGKVSLSALCRWHNIRGETSTSAVYAGFTDDCYKGQ